MKTIAYYTQFLLLPLLFVRYFLHNQKQAYRHAVASLQNDTRAHKAYFNKK